VTITTAFSPDYFIARDRFRGAVGRLGWQLESHPIDATGPAGERLTIDVGYCQGGDAERTLVVSSGIHGVEGYVGSAVQLALMQRRETEPAPKLRILLLHGLNPYGFAWHRRFDENNIDLNRNFLLPGESFEGSPVGYAELNRLLNPRRPPSRWEPFAIKALAAIARHGMPNLRRIIAAGQYDFPQGLFFGGAGASQTHQLLSEHFPRWLKGSRAVAHLDFHTGLGARGACKLLIDYPLSDWQRARLADWFGADSFESSDSSSIAYLARGGFGQWCVARKFAARYIFACAEFGTFGPIQMLTGLRAENQSHHWGDATAASTANAKQRLQELFCPADHRWRAKVLQRSIDLVDAARRGLSELTSAEIDAQERV
jgi:hypothetical protein